MRKGTMVIVLIIVLTAVALVQGASAEGTGDASPPTFLEDRSDTNGTSSAPILFEVVVFDETGVGGVDLVYWQGPLILRPRVYCVEMEPIDIDGSVNHVYATDDVWITWLNDSTMNYQFRAFDLDGNMGTSEVGMVRVWDDTPPALVEDLSDDIAYTGEDVSFKVNLTDNVRVERVTLWTNFGRATSIRDITPAGNASSDSNWTLYEMVWPDITPENDTWTFVATMNVPVDMTENMFYIITAYDGYGNELRTAEIPMEVVDTVPPHLEPMDAHPQQQATKGNSFSVSVLAEDNWGVKKIQLEYWFGSGPHENITIDYNEDATWPSRTRSFGIDVPRYTRGDLHYQFSARDLAINWGSTDVLTIRTVNAGPEFVNLVYWEVPEESLAKLDLAPHIRDRNDPLERLTITCSDPRIQVDGFLLRRYHPEWVPSYSVSLSVTDGEDRYSQNLTVHVLNSNDFPILTLVDPATGSVFEEGTDIHFTAFAYDEDGDSLTFTWREGDHVLHTGREFWTSGLQAGRHDITVTVSDGQISMERHIEVVVDSPWDVRVTWFLIALAYVVGLALVGREWFKMRRTPTEAIGV